MRRCGVLLSAVAVAVLLLFAVLLVSHQRMWSLVRTDDVLHARVLSLPSLCACI